MEQLEEDSVYFILKSGLSSRMSLERAQNVHHGHDNDKRSVMFNYKSVVDFHDIDYISKLDLRYYSAVSSSVKYKVVGYRYSIFISTWLL